MRSVILARFTEFADRRILKLSGYQKVLQIIAKKVISMFESVLGIDLLLFSHPKKFLPSKDLQHSFLLLQKLGIAKDMNTSLQNLPDEPSVYSTFVTLVGEQKRGYWGSSVDFFSPESTHGPAIGEALERWALTHCPTKTFPASYIYVRKQSIDIFAIAGISSATRSSQHPLYPLKFDIDSKFEWVSSTLLTKNDAHVYVPRQLIWFRNPHEQKKEPLLLPQISTGAAVAPTREGAIVNGLLESIERDAFMIYWLNEIAPQKVDISSIPDNQLQEIHSLAERYKLELHFLYLETDAPVHTISCITIDRTGKGPAVMAGAATDFSIASAAKHAARETLGYRSVLRNSMTAYNWNELRFPHTGAARIERLLYWSMQKQLEKISFFIDGPTLDIAALPQIFNPVEKNKKLKILVNFLKKRGYDATCTNLISKKMQHLLGLHAVKILVPQLQPLCLEPEESLRLEGGDRLNEIPNLLGYKKRETFNKVPHPFP